MIRPLPWRLAAGPLLALLSVSSFLPVLAQQLERDIEARGRVFPEIGPGARALKRDAAGRYFLLAAPGNVILIDDSAGKRLGQIPNANSKNAQITFADDIDLDSEGRLYVADRGANAVKIFSREGTLEATIPVAAPTSVAALSGGEFAVTAFQPQRLVCVYNLHGKLMRDFGDLSDLADAADLNRYLNLGRLASDPSSHIYYAFSYAPEPTLRKYDRLGYASYEITLATLDFEPEAQAKRRQIFELGKRSSSPNLKAVISAIGVDPASGEVWLAVSNKLLHFDKDGNRRATYRTYTAEGARVEPTAILIEADRILLADDPLGVFEFARPKELPAESSAP